MRDSKTTIYTKGIRITIEDYLFIQKTKGKKSMSGRLAEIIYGQRRHNNSNLRGNEASNSPAREDTETIN